MNLKKRTIIILGVIISIVLLIGVVVYAQSLVIEVSAHGFDYTIWREKVTLRGFEGDQDILEVPQEVEVDGQGLVITTIGKNAFADNEKLRKVIIGENIIEIGDKAFSNCTSLERVEFLGDAPEMGSNVFYGTPDELVLLHPLDRDGYERAAFSYDAEPFFLVEYLDAGSDEGQAPKDDGRYKSGDEIIALHNTGNLTKVGHTFTGWKDEDNIIEEGEAIQATSKHVQLSPNWVINKYDIVFHTNGEEKLEDLEIEWNNTITEPKKIEKKDHIFVNWFKDEGYKEVWNFEEQKVIEDVDLYAKWVAIPSVPSGFSGKTGGYDQVSLSWNALKGVTGYELYRSGSRDGEFKKITAIDKNAFTDRGLVTEKTYYYKVKAYTIDGEVEAFSDLSAVASGKGRLLTPNSFSAGRNASNGMRISWNTSAGATGYEIYRASSSSGNFDYLGNTNSTSFTDSKGTWNKGNYYKVRAYRKTKGKNVFSEYTSVKGYARVGDAVYSYLSSKSNRNNLHQQSIRLHGSTSNACVVYASESLRRAGVSVPTSMRSIDGFIPYLRNMGWVRSTDYKNIQKGDVVFTTDEHLNRSGRPTHTYIFMGWVESGNYDYAYIVDNQASYYDNQVMHIRNFLITDEVEGAVREPFSFYYTNK